MKGIAHSVDVELVELVEELLHGVVGRFDVSRGDHDELDLGIGYVSVYSVLLGRVQQPEVKPLQLRPALLCHCIHEPLGVSMNVALSTSRDRSLRKGVHGPRSSMTSSAACTT